MQSRRQRSARTCTLRLSLESTYSKLLPIPPNLTKRSSFTGAKIRILGDCSQLLILLITLRRKLSKKITNRAERRVGRADFAPICQQILTIVREHGHSISIQYTVMFFDYDAPASLSRLVKAITNTYAGTRIYTRFDHPREFHIRWNSLHNDHSTGGIVVYRRRVSTVRFFGRRRPLDFAMGKHDTQRERLLAYANVQLKSKHRAGEAACKSKGSPSHAECNVTAAPRTFQLANSITWSLGHVATAVVLSCLSYTLLSCTCSASLLPRYCSLARSIYVFCFPCLLTRPLKLYVWQ